MANTQTIPLHKWLRQRLEGQLAKAGRHPYANKGFGVKAAIFFLLPLSAYILLICLGASSFWLVLLFYFLFNAGSILLIVNLAHDASHNSISPNKKVDHYLSYTWNLVGISKTLWDMQHHFSHHNYSNIPSRDVDVNESQLVRFSPLHRYHSYFRYQHLYAPFLYLLFGLFVIYVKDFIMLFSDKLKPYGSKRLNGSFFWRLLLTKILYLFVALMIPVLALPFPWWQTLLVYLITLGICSGSMLLVLVIPHINEEAVLFEGEIKPGNQQEWMLHQLRATIDNSPDSKFIGWITGGLNTHLVHHLFPHICHVHYRFLSAELKKAMVEIGIPYRQRSFLRAISLHFLHLKKMGQRPGNSFFES